MVRQEWIICGAEFIEGDVIRWQEGVFESDRHNRKERVRIGGRTVTAQVMFDPEDINTLLELQVLASEGTHSYKGGELVRRARHTVSREDTERLAWSDEDARASVIDSVARSAAQGHAGRASARGKACRLVSRSSGICRICANWRNRCTLGQAAEKGRGDWVWSLRKDGRPGTGLPVKGRVGGIVTRPHVYMWACGKEGRLCGGLRVGLIGVPVLLRLQAMQEVHGALRMGGGGENRALVVLQHLEP